MTPEHIRQQQYRARRAVKLANANRIEAYANRLETAMRAIHATLSGNDKPLATQVRTIAEEALK